jgi:hypothetical protein
MSDVERADTRRSPARGAVLGCRAAELGGDRRDVVESLHHTYDVRVGAVLVDSEIQQVADRFVEARIRSFIPLFVRCFAATALRRRRAQHALVTAPPRAG